MGFGLVPTPESDLTICLVNLATGYAVARFDKRELAIAIGTPDAANCRQCRKGIISVGMSNGKTQTFISPRIILAR